MRRGAVGVGRGAGACPLFRRRSSWSRIRAWRWRSPPRSSTAIRVEAWTWSGITGTNGKTTTTYLLDSIMRAAGRTHRDRRDGRDARRRRAGRVEPDDAGVRATSQALLARMRDAGVSAAALEVSSHAIDLHRVDGLRFAVAAFTNLTQDHLDYHSTLEEYFSVKRRLFTDFDVRGPCRQHRRPRRRGAGCRAVRRDHRWDGPCGIRTRPRTCSFPRAARASSCVRRWARSCGAPAAGRRLQRQQRPGGGRLRVSRVGSTSSTVVGGLESGAAGPGTTRAGRRRAARSR